MSSAKQLMPCFLSTVSPQHISLPCRTRSSSCIVVIARWSSETPTMRFGGRWLKSILQPTLLRCGIAVMLISILPVAILCFVLPTVGHPMCRIFFICKPLSLTCRAAWQHWHRFRLSVGWQTWVSMFLCSFSLSFGLYGSATVQHCWWRSLAFGRWRCCGWLPPTESFAMFFPSCGIFRSLLPSLYRNELHSFAPHFLI